MAYAQTSQQWTVNKARLAQTAKPKEGMTLIVAASDSNDTTRADYICTGSSDDVTINQALNALPSVGGTVILLEGTYNITSSITIPNDDIWLKGNGRGTKIVTTQNIFMIVANNVKGIEVSDLYLDGIVGFIDTDPFNNHGVYFDTVTNSKISDVQVLKNFGIAFYLYYCSNCRIVRCQTLGTERGLIAPYGVGLGIQLVYTDNSEVLFCHIDGNNDSEGGIAIAYGNNNLIMGNHILYIGEDAITAGYGNRNRILGNHIDVSATENGIWLDNEDKCMICNNIINDAKRGVDITNATCNDTLVTDNIIISASLVAIRDLGTNTISFNNQEV